MRARSLGISSHRHGDRIGGFPRLTLLLLLVAIGSFSPGAPAQAQRRNAVPEKRFSEGSELVQLDFRDVELAVVIEAIAKITGKNFIYDDRVRGRVTIVSPSEVTAEQAYAVFESVDRKSVV